MCEDEVNENFGAEVARKATYAKEDFEGLNDGSKSLSAASIGLGEFGDVTDDRLVATVYQVWCKESKKVYHIVDTTTMQKSKMIHYSLPNSFHAPHLCGMWIYRTQCRLSLHT